MVNKKRAFRSSVQAVNLVTLTRPASAATEQFQKIRENIKFALAGQPQMKLLAVTSASPQAGKSTVAANLAVTFANNGKQVLLVGADLRKPTVYNTFNLNNQIGLSTVLTTHQTVNEVVQETEIANLSVLTSGPRFQNPAELLASDRMHQVLNEMRHIYDVIILDLPSLLEISDARIMSAAADGTILVIRDNLSLKSDVRQAKEILKFIKANVLGVVYNEDSTIFEKYNYYLKR